MKKRRLMPVVARVASPAFALDRRLRPTRRIALVIVPEKRPNNSSRHLLFVFV
jgi:hypothetical protein